MLQKTGLLLLLLCAAFWSKADYWELPTCQKYYSTDSRATVFVVPACLTASKKKRKKPIDTCNGNCPEERPCMATVLKQDTSYTFELINLFAPHKVFISNDGVYVVTLNDWGSAGTGNNVLVIYKSGSLLKNYSLPQISPIPVWDYYRTVSSFWWFHELRFVNNQLLKIIFRDKNGEKYEKYFHL